MASRNSRRDGAAMEMSEAGPRKRQIESARRVGRQLLYEEDTGLVSKEVFRDRGQHALALSRRPDRRVALVVLELDTGNPVTSTVARELLRQLRREDTVALLDEGYVGVLVEDVPGAVVAQRIRQRLEQSLGACRASSVAVSDSNGRIGFWLGAATA